MMKLVSEMGADEAKGMSASDKRNAKSLSEMDGDERVIATAEHIVFSVDRLDTTHDMLGILLEFDSRFSLKAGRLEAHLEERFRSAEELVFQWAPPTTNLRYYLRAVDEIHSLMTKDDTRSDILERAQGVNRVATVRLLEEFRHALYRHSQLPDTECLYNRLSGLDDTDSVPDNGDSAPGVVTWEDYRNLGLLLDLVRPEAVPDIRDIAQRLIVGEHEHDCCRVYGDVRREFLDETLRRLGLQKLSSEEIQKTSWESLEGKFKKWIQGIQIAVRILFVNEKELCSRIFQKMGSVEEVCFSETFREPMMQLLIFSEAMAISCRSSERLFRILDIYETLSDLTVDINCIFSDEGIRAEASDIVVRLGEVARGTFCDFPNLIERDGSKTPIAGGSIHPLNSFVMNYCRLLFDYTGSLMKLVTADIICPDDPSNPKIDESMNSFVLSGHLLKITGILEKKLDEKSKLYKDPSLSHLFLMNNIHYIVQEVKDSSKLQAHLGDDWVRKHCGQVRQLATNYQRATWNKVFGCLDDAGLHPKGSFSFSGGVPKRALKERFKKFNAAFEEIYRTQTTWTVPDWQLREELRISITDKLLPAYRSFVGRYRSHLDSERNPEKYIKFTPEGMEHCLLELFEGSPRSNRHHQVLAILNFD